MNQVMRIISQRVLRCKKSWSTANTAAVLFFLVFLCVGLLVHTDYGIGWDETTQRDIGLKNYYYITKGDPALLNLRDRWYGPGFELFLIYVQNNSSDMSIYYSRHLFTFLTFFTGCLGFYFLCRRLTKHQWLALIGTGFLVFSPRIFSDAFYNSKDIPFLILYVFSLLSMFWFLDRPNYLTGLLHALMTAALVSLRLPGLIIPALTLLGISIEIFSHRIDWKKAVFILLIYILVSAGFCILFWPALWENPVYGFIEAFRFMSHFPYDLKMLFMGKIISSLELPWYYIPVWLAITTPLLYLIGFIPGVIKNFLQLKSNLRSGFSAFQRDDFLILLAFLGPLLAVIALKSVLYDAWRHMFFIYPAFLLISLKGYQWAWLKVRERLGQHAALALAVVLLLTGLLVPGYWMVVNHPYQNVYFNRLAGKDMLSIQQKYMLDYWGLAYREGIEALLASDASSQINVFMETTAGERTLVILPKDEAQRIHVVRDLQKADYFIGNYYMLPKLYSFHTEIYTVQVGNAKILSVYQLSEEEKNNPSIEFTPH